MDNNIRVIHKFEVFVLGKCRCGCNEDIPIRNKRGELAKFKAGHQNRGKNHPCWQGGWRERHGYIQTLQSEHPNADKDGYIMTHRLVYEYYLKILFDEDVYIPADYDIHHIDENKQNNAIFNLTPLTRANHRKQHTKDMSDRRCVICGSDKTIIQKNGTPDWRRYNNGWICHKCNNRLFYHMNTNRPFKQYVPDDRACLKCKSKTTVIRKTGYAVWYKFEDGFICNKCYKRSKRMR